MLSGQFYEKWMSVRKEYTVATWSCHIHGYNGNSHLQN